MSFFKKLKSNEIRFRCNICGKSNYKSLDTLSREISSCDKCKSTVRMRAIIYVLSIELFGKSIILPEFPNDKNIVGIGMSDWIEYANRLSSAFSYTNTFYHQEPKLDITSIPKNLHNSYDFIISSDVFEHVLSPVSIAFENAYKLLKKQGILIFTVPYTKEGKNTKEHFGILNNFEILQQEDKYILKDIDKSGNLKTYNNLVFHGGPGSTLEMRVFSEKSLMNELKKANFSYVKIYNEAFLPYGIYWDKINWSLPIAVRH